MKVGYSDHQPCYSDAYKPMFGLVHRRKNNSTYMLYRKLHWKVTLVVLTTVVLYDYFCYGAQARGMRGQARTEESAGERPAA
jgi:hypothetical protein